ncbi:peptide ABC transporter permease [Methylococcaceae bacterium HT4]|nr:peptide ABC transporter permease [Methylococcaceae bacterium HT4]TXL20346.1 peptide ABC transporter permease [Methylococcaceae bacterium HT5]TXL21603.1 peptide ABC transporter permease [Methylococcaceae bacterium HT2]
MIILWTDALIYILISVITILFFSLRKKEHFVRPWKQVANSRTAMASLVFLVFFIIIGLLDSVHFKPSNANSHDIISLLDYCVDPIRLHQEKSYSAPFSAYSFSKELIVTPDQANTWGYQRLQYAASHLTNVETEKTGDILAKAMQGWALGAGLVIILFCGYHWLKKLRFFSCKSVNTVFATLFLLASISTMLFELSTYYHVMGTDKVGEDVFYQAIKSIRTGLVIGSLTTLIMLPLAIIFGILAGFFRGWVDDVIQYIYTTLNSIPGVLLIAASILMVQVYMANHQDQFTSLVTRADMRLLFLCLILGVTSWTGLCRMLRAETLKLRGMEYVQAAQALGVPRYQILYRHILPNVMHIVLISVVLDFSSLVLAEAVLSYVNIGVDPTTYSWGNMINGARLEMAREPVVWWSLAASFVFMFGLVLSANLFADTVRDAFDPRRAQS